MGWYVTCKYCKEEFKYSLGCDCADNHAKLWESIWINSTVIGHKVFPTELYYHIQKDSVDYYFYMLLSSVGRERPSEYSMITKEQYENNSPHI